MYGNESEIFNGNAGNDEIHGGDKATTQALDGGAGDDTLKGGDEVENQEVAGSGGNDFVKGGDDVVEDQTLYGDWSAADKENGTNGYKEGKSKGGEDEIWGGNRIGGEQSI